MFINKNIVISVLVVIVLCLGGYLVYDKAIDKDEKVENNCNTLENQNSTVVEEDTSAKSQDIYGYYVYENDYTYPDNSVRHITSTLSLNPDGSAAYTESDGSAFESTKGTFKIEGNKIVYTREYYYYKTNSNELNTSIYDDKNNTTKEFTIINNNTIQGSFGSLTQMQLLRQK